MTLSSYAFGIYEDISREGRLVLLRRLSGPDTFFDVNVYAFGIDYHIDSRERVGGADVAGGIVQGDRIERISNKEIDERQWPGPPRRGDIIVIAGRTCNVRGVETKIVGGETVEHVLQVRGT